MQPSSVYNRQKGICQKVLCKGYIDRMVSPQSRRCCACACNAEWQDLSETERDQPLSLDPKRSWHGKRSFIDPSSRARATSNFCPLESLIRFYQREWSLALGRNQIVKNALQNTQLQKELDDPSKQTINGGECLAFIWHSFLRVPPFLLHLTLDLFNNPKIL